MWTVVHVACICTHWDMCSIEHSRSFCFTCGLSFEKTSKHPTSYYSYSYSCWVKIPLFVYWSITRYFWCLTRVTVFQEIIIDTCKHWLCSAHASHWNLRSLGHFALGVASPEHLKEMKWYKFNFTCLKILEITLTSMCISNSGPRLSCQFNIIFHTEWVSLRTIFSCTSVILIILLILGHKNELIIDNTYLSDCPILTVYKAWHWSAAWY